MDEEQQHSGMNGGHAREEFLKLQLHNYMRLLLWLSILSPLQMDQPLKMLPAEPRMTGQMGNVMAAHTGSFQHRPLKCLWKSRHWLTERPFHHDGLFLCSVLWLGYLAEVDTAAFSTDPYFGWPPLHCLAAIQVVWDRVWRHQWSWEGEGEREGRRGETVMFKSRRCKDWSWTVVWF